MRRDLGALADQQFDLLVVGGGIAGAWAAWDAALRGLRVALVEKGDFAQGASAHCFKLLHGGIRYLQHADLARVRRSSGERRTLLRLAPHLAHPLPILVPTRRGGWQGKSLLHAGARAYDALTWDRNAGVRDPARRIPASRRVSRSEALALCPALEAPDLTGGVLIHEGQMYSPARIVVALLAGACDRGAEVANHCEAERLVLEGRRVCGAVLRDTQGGETFEVRAHHTLNAAGGWAEGLLSRSLERGLEPRPAFSRDACLVWTRPLSRVGLALPGATRDPDAWVSRQARHLFLAPWRGVTLAGVWHVVHEGDADRTEVSEQEVEAFAAELGAACPGLGVGVDDVALVQAGLTLFGENERGARDLRYGKRELFVDHAATHGIDGLLTSVAVRFTVARGGAERAVTRVFEKLGRAVPPCATDWTPLPGGEIEDFEDFVGAASNAPPHVPASSLDALLRNHGTSYRPLLDAAIREPERLGTLAGTATLGSEIVHAVREEMAQQLSDVVFRRTDLGSAGFPGSGALEAAADLMAAELGWSSERRARELGAVERAFPARGRPCAAGAGEVP